MENINLYECQYNNTKGHSNGFIRTSNLKCIQNDSHSFVSKSNKQEVYIIDEYFTLPDRLTTHDVFKIVHNKLIENNLDNVPISSFHFMARNIEEMFVKEFANCGNKDLGQIIPLIESNDIKYYGRMNLLNYKGNISNIKLICPKIEIVNNDSHYKYVLTELLQKYNVSFQVFKHWIKINIIK